MRADRLRMFWSRSSGLAVFGTLSVAVLLFAVLPLSDLGAQIYSAAVATLAVLIGFVAVAHYRPPRPGGWLLALGGLAAWVLGDVVWTIEQYGLERDIFPAVSDVFYVAGYAGLAAGALLMVRTRRTGRDATALLDSLIVATGVAVVVTTFVIAPLAADSTVSLAAKLVSSFYPIADLTLLAMLARLWTTRGARTPSCVLLTAAIGLTLAVDLVWNLWVIDGVATDGELSRLADTAWFASYVLMCTAAMVPSMRALAEPLPDRTAAQPSGRRLIALAAGLMLPAIVLLVQGFFGTLDRAWPIIGIGMLALTTLILARMSGLVHVVQTQSQRLAAVARTDSLTGAPNRRTWDHELTRSAAASLANGTPLCVAMIDLDSFKAYNDTNGHQAGDLLLREAVAAWTHTLGADGMLARYGGEEFAVLLPGVKLADATEIIRSLRPGTPSAQTFSAGVCQWDPATDPTIALALADDSLYLAKRTGRDRVVAHGGTSGGTQSADQLPSFTLVLQPVVRLDTGAVVAHEALSRFHGTDDDVVRAFTRAHVQGYGDLLEIAAITAALTLPGRPDGQELLVNASPTALASERFWARLPATLVGVVVEISELRDGVDESVLAESMARLRSRGARIALDDLGSRQGHHELTRLAVLRPDIVKVDRSVVHGCATNPGASAVLAGLAAYAYALGAVVCAEGVEDSADLAHLVTLGVTHAQGYLLGRPKIGWTERLDGAEASAPGTISAAQVW